MATTADSVVVNLEARTEQYNAKINQAATNFQNAANKIEGNTARIGNAQRNLGRQVADVGASLSSGASPFLILGQQAGQVADALADTGGRAAKVASFFAGPWGAALLAAGSVLAIFAEKALAGGESVESLTDKLRANAEKSELAAQAQAIFDRTTQGLTIALREEAKALDQANASTQRGIYLALAKAEADRAATIEARKRAAAELGVAVSRAEGNRVSARTNAGQGTGGLAGAASNIALAGADAEVVRLRQQEAQAIRNVATAENSVVKARAPIIRNQIAESLDKATAATGRYERALDTLYAKLKRGNITEAQYAAGVRNATNRRDAALEAAREEGKKPPKGTSAETLARRAETARIRDVRNNEAFNNELEQFNSQIIAAQRDRATTAQEAADFEREAIQADFRKRQQQIAADLSAKKFDSTEAATLNERNEYRKALLLRNVAINEDVRTLQEIAEGQRVDIGVLQDEAQARLAIAESQEERKNIELELIRLKYQERKEQLDILLAQAVIKKDIQAQANINRQLEALPGLRRAEEVGVEQRNRGRFDQYRRNLDSADALSDSIDGIKIQTLEAVTDELTNATKAALGLKGAFGDIVGELIRIGIQRKLIGPLADALFGKADGTPASGGGGIGSIFASIFSALGKRASGGNTRGGGAYLVGENGPELFAPSGSGKIYPTGALGSPGRSGGNTIVQQTFVLDNRGGITTPQLIDYVNRTARTEAARAGRAAYNASPVRSAQIDNLGT